MNGAALRLTDVACLRGGRMLFRGVDLKLEPGGGALLTGPNGVGKSSLLRVCAGLLPAFAGMVERSGDIAMSDERLALDMEAPLAKALDFWARLDRAGPDTPTDRLTDRPTDGQKTPANLEIQLYPLREEDIVRRGGYVACWTNKVQKL
ncbi:MAG: heme ABC transporter ATP-binding protein CcmA [Sphingobium sp.]|nr:MAG: heme ABC transporter ATP-binding protein CcmA [Sphingobium sp.]